MSTCILKRNLIDALKFKDSLKNMYGHCTDRAIIQTGSIGFPTADAITTIPSLFPHAEMLLTINDSTPICTTF